MKIRNLARAGIIAALYAALTVLLAPISFSVFQCRISEALCVLPFLTGAAVPGLFIGCFLGNLLTGAPIYDVIFGSLATLVASILTWILGKKQTSDYLVPLPTILVNAVVVGAMLRYIYQIQIHLVILMLITALGEALAGYLLGIPLLHFLEKQKGDLFTDESKKH